MSEEYELYPHQDLPDYLPSKEDVCCETMFNKMRTNADCTQHGYSCPDRGIIYRSDGIFLIRAPAANYSIDFCPWCGKSLTKTPNKGARMLGFDPNG